MPFLKRAIRREDGDGNACAFLMCDCGHKLRLPVVDALPLLAYPCVCGRQYDFNGWLLTDESEQRKPEPHARLRNFQLALLDAESEPIENLELAAEMLEDCEHGVIRVTCDKCRQ